MWIASFISTTLYQSLVSYYSSPYEIKITRKWEIIYCSKTSFKRPPSWRVNQKLNKVIEGWIWELLGISWTNQLATSCTHMLTDNFPHTAKTYCTITTKYPRYLQCSYICGLAYGCYVVIGYRYNYRRNLSARWFVREMSSYRFESGGSRSDFTVRKYRRKNGEGRKTGECSDREWCELGGREESVLDCF